MIADSGAYPYLSPYVLLYATIMSTGPYRVDNLHVDSVAVATNQPFTSAFRGFGGPQACIAYEQQMDEIARALNMDPLEVRRVNYLKTGDHNGTGQVIKSAAWLEEIGHAGAGGAGREETGCTKGLVKVGRGFASYFQSYGRITWFHDTSRAWVGVEMDGTVVIRCGAPDLGAGQINSLCQIAAEMLGVPLADVTIYSTDSAVTPLAGTSTATRQLYMSGNAVFQAASAVREVLLDRASKHFEEAPENLDLADGDGVCQEQRSGAMSLPLEGAGRQVRGRGAAALQPGPVHGPFHRRDRPRDRPGRRLPRFHLWRAGGRGGGRYGDGRGHGAQERGLPRRGPGHQPGRRRGQIAGGSHQGMGYALMEEFVVEDGVTQTPSLAEYLIPTSVDFPTTEVIILESGTGVGPFGAKGIGEPALTPAAPAVANAVADAIGVRIHELPLTPQRVLAALERKRAAATE